MRYLCLVYIEEGKFDTVSPREGDILTDESLAYDDELRRKGHYITSAALQAVAAATTLRMRNGKLSVTDGPFAETKEHLGGFILIEARDLNEAIQAAGGFPWSGWAASRSARSWSSSGRRSTPVERSRRRGLARARSTSVYRAESRRVLATLIRLLGDFELAEEALHDAFVAAAEQWPRDGVPENPRAWLVSAGRFKAIDRIRRRARFDAVAATRSRSGSTAEADEMMAVDDEAIEDDRLRLIFTCCHPALPPDAQVALTLREVCGLTTEEIAHAFLTAPPRSPSGSCAPRPRSATPGMPYQVPAPAELPDRLDTVLHVVYLVFNEGYSASSGESAHPPRSLRRGDPARPACWSSCCPSPSAWACWP